MRMLVTDVTEQDFLSLFEHRFIPHSEIVLDLWSRLKNGMSIRESNFSDDEIQALLGLRFFLLAEGSRL